jgi:hypothetical protein
VRTRIGVTSGSSASSPVWAWLAPDRQPQATRAYPLCPRRPLQHPQAASRSGADTTDIKGPPTPRRCKNARPAPPTRPTRRTHP